MCKYVVSFKIAGSEACGSCSEKRSVAGNGGALSPQVVVAPKSDEDVEPLLWAWQADILKSAVDVFQSGYPPVKFNKTVTGAAADQTLQGKRLFVDGRTQRMDEDGGRCHLPCGAQQYDPDRILIGGNSSDHRFSLKALAIRSVCRRGQAVR